MKRNIFKLAILTALFGVTLVCTSSCKKDPMPTIYGHWETVNAIGFNWQYDITDGGQFCKSLPEYFPETSFCYDYAVANDADHTTTITAPTAETWTWEFVGGCADVADVSVTLANGEKQRFILKRIR